MSLRTINSVAVGELGTRGVLVISCDGRLFDNSSKLVFSGLLNVTYTSCAFVFENTFQVHV